MRWWVLVLCGCNQVYGLDGTQSRDGFAPFADEDHDGIPDDIDNCPGVANHDQADVDGDKIGDACDQCTDCLPCGVGPNHDEDGDKLADGCDNCPAVANADQANADGDDLGDACDPDNTVMHHRRFFDGFGALSPDWLQGGAAWAIANDSAVPAPGLDTFDYQLQHATLQATAAEVWFIEVGIDTPPMSGNAQLRALSGAGAQFCGLQSAANGMWDVTNAGLPSGNPFVIDGYVRLRMRAEGPIGSQRVTCEALAASSTTMGPFILGYDFTLQLYTFSRTRFRYFEVIGP